MDKRECEKCHKTMATVKFNKNDGNLDWWCCEKCYHVIVSEDATSNVRRNPDGFPPAAPAPAYPYGFIV